MKKILTFFKNFIQEQIWFWCNFFCNKYLQLTCQGLENLPKNCSYIVVSNHCSHLDGMVIIVAQKKHLKNTYSLAAKDYFFNSSSKKWCCQNLLNMIPFERQTIFLDCLKHCQMLINQGKNLVFFPEGTRSLTGKIQSFQLGIGFLLFYLKIPVIPAYIEGTYQSLPKGKFFPKKVPIQVIFGEAIEFNFPKIKLNKQEKMHLYQQITNTLETKIKALEKSIK